MTTTTKRKAYVREMKADWWKKIPFYKMYMIREATAIPTVWFCLVLLYGVYCLGVDNAFVESFIPFLKNPLVVVLNLVSLVALLYHAATLYVMTPQVLALANNKGERVPVNLVTKAMWILTAVISLIVLVLAI